MNQVCAFESKRELLSRAGVIGPREKRRVWLQHGRRGEVEIPLAVRAVLRDILHQVGGFAYGVPVNPVGGGDDGASFDVRQLRQRLRQQMHGHCIVRIMQHPGTYIGQEFFLYRELIQIFEEVQRISLA